MFLVECRANSKTSYLNVASMSSPFVLMQGSKGTMICAGGYKIYDVENLEEAKFVVEFMCKAHEAGKTLITQKEIKKVLENHKKTRSKYKRPSNEC